MSVPLLGAILATFVVFKGTYGWCNLCPGVSTLEDKSPLCRCENAFYDPTTGKCVGYFNCPIFKPLLESGALETIVSAGVDAVTSSVVTTTVELIAEDTLDILLPNITESVEVAAKRVMESSKDVDVMNSIIKKRLIKGTLNISDQFSFLFNPYLLRNKKLLDACKNNTMCVLQTMMQKDGKRLENAISIILPQVIDQIILSLSDIHVYASTNCTKGCPLIKMVAKSKLLLTDILRDLKENCGYLTKFIVKALVSVRPVENEVFDKVLSKIGMDDH